MADHFRGQISVHTWHLDIHKDGIIVVGGCIFHDLYRFVTVTCIIYHKACLLQDPHGNLTVKVIILHHKDAFPGDLGGIVFVVVIAFIMGFRRRIVGRILNGIFIRKT